MTARSPIVLVGAVLGSLSVITVATIFFFDSLRPMSVGHRPDMQGLALSLVLLAYVASVWVVGSGRFGRLALVIHVTFAVLALGSTMFLAFAGVSLLRNAQCGLGAGMGLVASVTATLLALGLVPAEIYCLGRRRAG